MADRVSIFAVSDNLARLANFISQRRATSKKTYTVLLGAGASIESGGSSWLTLCRKALADLGIHTPDNTDPIDYLTNKILPEHPESVERFLAIAPQLENLKPSLGLRHLAQLVADGYIDTIVTTNFDPLVEVALAPFFNSSELKVLVRGEVPDDRIARYITNDVSRIKIIKLHGDLLSRILFVRGSETRSFSSDLQQSLRNLFDDGLIIVGQQLQDRDLINTLAQTARGPIYYVNPELPQQGSFAASLLAEPRSVAISGEEGKTDVFFIRLNMYIHKKYSDSDETIEKKKDIQNDILQKQERGRGYINYSIISDWVEDFAKKILRHKPDLILFINDPSAPGGMELKKRMQQYLPDNVEVDTIVITGEKGSRTFHRQVRTLSADAPPGKYEHIYILDAITFSGNTLSLAKEWAQKQYPYATIYTGVLLISQQLVEQLNDSHPLQKINYQQITDRHEIFFPWGHTHTTASFDRKFADIDGIRSVHISKRPWGTIEILADQIVCSVRLLTIEADEKLSFQRHLCRDELFVALDDNIGLDVCGETLGEPFDPFDMKIKSLILEKGDYIFIPRGIWHRTKASKDRVRLLELGFGLYDQDNDIERLQDAFGREGESGRV